MPAEKSIGRPAIPFAAAQHLWHVMSDAVKSSLCGKLMSLWHGPWGAFSKSHWQSVMPSRLHWMMGRQITLVQNGTLGLAGEGLAGKTWLKRK